MGQMRRGCHNWKRVDEMGEGGRLFDWMLRGFGSNLERHLRHCQYLRIRQKSNQRFWTAAGFGSGVMGLIGSCRRKMKNVGDQKMRAWVANMEHRLDGTRGAHGEETGCKGEILSADEDDHDQKGRRWMGGSYQERGRQMRVEGD